MLSAESATYKERDRQQKAYTQRIRDSLIQAATTPWNYDGNSSKESLRRDSAPNSGIRRQSVDAANLARRGTKHVLANKSTLKHIKKFEIILNRRSKPQEVQEALVHFRRDSIDSIRNGTQGPSIKEYIDLGSEAYEPGESIVGHIHLTISKPLPVKNISTRMRGTYIVAFEHRTEGESTTNTEQITFLQADATLPVGSQILEPGIYNYAFKFKLPLNIPGTMFFERFQTVYEGASVVYSIEAIVNIQSNTDELFHSPIAKEIVEVVRRYPERIESGYHKPCSVNKKSDLQFCCYDMGSLSLRVELGKLIYTEGESMLLDVRLSNDSKLKVKQVDIALVQHSTFKSKTLRGEILKARTILIVHHLPLDNLGYGDADNRIALTLPDEMQTSTTAHIVPPTSFINLHLPVDDAEQERKVKKSESKEKGRGTSKHIEFEDVEAEEDDATFLILDTDYHTLYDISYYLHVKARTSIEWFSMKGPEIHFPITIEGTSAARKHERGRKAVATHKKEEKEKETSDEASANIEDVKVKLSTIPNIDPEP